VITTYLRQRLLGVLFLAAPCVAFAQSASGGALASAPSRSARDGSRDFDFEIGTWRTELKLLVSPIGEPAEWAQYVGTSVVSKVWGGDANVVELDASGARGRIRALSLRLYDPASRQWSLNFANARGGGIATPSVGGFRDGRGEFHSHESVGGRVRWVRFEITPISRDSIRFVQSVSGDGGRTWTPNWIALDTRVAADSLPAELVSAMATFDRAQWEADTATLARLVTDDYVLVNSDGSVDRKAKYLSDFLLPGLRMEPYVIEQRLEKRSDGTAVVFGLQRLSWTQDGTRHKRTLRIVHVWTNRSGRWQATHTQLTRVPD
jgi:ketosteroid isomerase-like protein